MRVLITDDSGMIRMILKSLLKQLKITQIEEAGDGSAALDSIKKSIPDLLLLDLHMPGMDGLTCLAALKADPATAQLPVVMISSDTATSQIARARELGVLAYIEKPFRLDSLREAVDAVILKA